MYCIHAILSNISFEYQARIQRGDRGSGPPLRLSEVGSYVEAWSVGEGVQRLFLPHEYQFFLARFARQHYTNILHVYILQSSMFKMEQSSFLYISLIQIIKRIQLPIPCFYEGAFSYYSCLELHDFTPFKPRFFWGRTPDPPPRHTYNIKTNMSKNKKQKKQKKNMSSVCFCRKGLAISQKTMRYRK